MRIFLILLISIIPIQLFGQNKTDDSIKLNNEIQKIINEFEESELLEGYYVGIVHSDLYSSFNRLTNIADEIDLLCLTNHKNPIVRSYAFWGLAKIHSKLIKTIIEKHIDDNEIFYSMFGSQLREETVIEFMIRVVSSKEFSDCKKLNKGTLERLKK